MIDKLLPSFLIDLFLKDPDACSEVSQRLAVMTLYLDSPSSLPPKALLLGQAHYTWLFPEMAFFKESLPFPDRLPSGPTGSSDLPSCGCPSRVYDVDFFLEGSSGLGDFWEAAFRPPSVP